MQFWKWINKRPWAFKLIPPYSRYADDTFSVQVKLTAPNPQVSHLREWKTIEKT